MLVNRKGSVKVTSSGMRVKVRGSQKREASLQVNSLRAR